MTFRFKSLTAGLVSAILSLASLQAEPAPQSVFETDISKDIMTLRLDPMTKTELENEVAAWQEILKQHSEKIVDLEIQAISGEIDKTKANQELVKLREQKAALVSRTELIIDAYELKGGAADDMKKYVAAIKGIKTGVRDFNSRVHSFNSWLSSQEGGVKVLVQALQFLGVIVVFWIISIFASKIISRALDKQVHISELLKVFINKMSRRVILVIGLIVALGTVGVNVGAALALIGGGAFILAFALQDTLSNFASGIMLIIYRPFDVSDAVDIGGISGVVDSVSLVSTTIRTFDNKKVLVPNKKVWGETITNITGMTTRRVDMTFGIGYDDDYEKAQEILERIVSEHELVLRDPAPNIRMHELADSSVNFICRPWAATADHWAVYWDITKRVKKEFDAAGVSIPYPQRDVHVHQVTPKG
jgi:small conductance mechanosensitive channel